MGVFFLYKTRSATNPKYKIAPIALALCWIAWAHDSVIYFSHSVHYFYFPIFFLLLSFLYTSLLQFFLHRRSYTIIIVIFTFSHKFVDKFFRISIAWVTTPNHYYTSIHFWFQSYLNHMTFDAHSLYIYYYCWPVMLFSCFRFWFLGSFLLPIFTQLWLCFAVRCLTKGKKKSPIAKIACNGQKRNTKKKTEKISNENIYRSEDF